MKTIKVMGVTIIVLIVMSFMALGSLMIIAKYDTPKISNEFPRMNLEEYERTVRLHNYHGTLSSWADVRGEEWFYDKYERKCRLWDPLKITYALKMWGGDKR